MVSDEMSGALFPCKQTFPTHCLIALVWYSVLVRSWKRKPEPLGGGEKADGLFALLVEDSIWQDS